ncbi:nitrogenase component 1 [Clostridium sp. YIM B02506]|uniref:nitrogenase component 1 n=1 Tax=Clostridium sp. YIM B02506 TaxID=2910680 RepID=UPI001EEE4524|nr:nitrogenase component 1 [Clostridium sp. YIM B02506]
MGLYKYYSIPSDRMGALWTLLSIRGACILEFGTAGTTRFALNNFHKMKGVQNGQLYTTHLDENDIAMGDVSRMDKAIDDIVNEGLATNIFLMSSTVSSVIGIDLEAYCYIYSEKYPHINFIYISNDGFKGDWTLGVKNTLETLVAHIPKEANKSENFTYNIIGACADDYNYVADCMEVDRIMKEGFNGETICTLTSNTSIKEIENMGAAHLNIVMRSEGEEAAKVLERNFGTPYVMGRPYGLKGTFEWIKKIEKEAKISIKKEFVENEEKLLKEKIDEASLVLRNKSICLSGHYDVVRGIRDFLRDEIGININNIWCSSPSLSTEEVPFYEEKIWEEIILKGDYDILMGNGVVTNIGKENCKKLQIDLPNLVYSRGEQDDNPYVGFKGALCILNKLIK